MRLALRDVRRGDARRRSRRRPASSASAIAANLRHDKLESEINEATLAAGLPATLPFAAELDVPARPGAASEGGARAGARQARELQPARLRLPRRRRRRRGDRRRRARGDRAAPARLAARPDRRRGDDPGQQHLGRLARRLRRARRSTAARQSLAPGVKVRMGTQARAARRHRRRPVRLGDVAAAPLRRPRQPVAADRLRPPRQDAPRWRRRSRRRTCSLLAIVSDFDAAYAAYNGFQGAIERYWALALAAAGRHRASSTRR